MTRTKKSEKKEFDFSNELKINELALEKEWLRQPMLFMRWAELAADADLEAKRAQEVLKTIRSDLIMKAAKGEVPGMAKPTGSVIEAWYRTQPDYIDAKKEMIDAEHTRDLLFNAVSAFRMRRNALEGLVQLQLSGYYSAPKVPDGSNLNKADERLAGRADKKAAELVKSRKEAK